MNELRNRQDITLVTQETAAGDFPGGPVVKNLPSSAMGLGLIPGQGGGSHMLTAAK